MDIITGVILPIAGFGLVLYLVYTLYNYYRAARGQG